MKQNLAPTLTQRVAHHFILWFKVSNKYVVVDNNLHKLITIFLSSKLNSNFITAIEKLGHDASEANQFLIDINNFLNDCNVSREEMVGTSTAFTANNRLISYTYEIDYRCIRVYYSSEYIKSLVHPQLEHLVSSHVVNDCFVVFDLLEEGDTLCLFKDGNLIGTWPSKDFYLLQGKFAMSLLCALHNNDEMDWMGTFHASTIVENDQAAMIIGDSGKGKSTFTALLLAHGIEVLADDLTPVLAKDSLVYPYPAGISIKSGAFEILKLKLPNFESLPKHYINPYKGYVKYVAAPKQKSYLTGYPCKIMISIHYKENTKTHLEPLAINDALATLIPESWLAPDIYNAQQFLNWLQGMQFYQLTYSNTQEAIDSVSSLLDK